MHVLLVDVTKQPTCMKGSCCANNRFFTGSCKTNTQQPQRAQRERRPGAPKVRQKASLREHVISSRAARVSSAVRLLPRRRQAVADTVDEGMEIVKGSEVSEGSGTAASDLCPSRSSRRGTGLC